MGTLEPINPIQYSPYGAFIINNEMVCTPTSLCTWQNGETKPYCSLSLHTRSPTCVDEEQSGLIIEGCYQEKTCGGKIDPVRNKIILQNNPDYIKMIQNHEQNLIKFNPPPHTKKRNIVAEKHTIDIVFYLLISLLSIWIVILVLYFFFKKKKKTSVHKKHTSLKRSSSLSKSRRI